MLTRLHDLLRLRTSPSIFFGAAAIIALFVIATVTFTETMDTVFSAASDWLYTNLGWFYIFGVTLFLVFLLYLVASRYGRVKLGPDDEPPEHSGIAWFAMLFAAGIGSILMFWGVAEPVSHFGNPPRGASLGIEPGTPEAAADAMNFTLYHFPRHHWAIFTLPALCFAYFIHKRNLPPRISSIFQPFWAAYMEYIRNRLWAKRALSSPPTPPRISTMTLFSSLGSLGSSRICSWA